MKTKTSLTCLQRSINGLAISVEIAKNPFNIDPSLLFEMAARINTKRSFLFVSKVLGKHIPVHPYIPHIGGAMLAYLYYWQNYNLKPCNEIIDIFKQALAGNEDALNKAFEILQKRLGLSEKTLFIGFAETATALGHAMFNTFSGDHFYIHTTREDIKEQYNLFNFKEEHSHAPNHSLFTNNRARFAANGPIVLIDDEITTGKSMLNLIRELHSRYPRNTYTIAALLDWRTEESIAAFKRLEDELNITISVVSLIKGSVKAQGTFTAPAPSKSLKHIGSKKLQVIKTFINGFPLSNIPSDISYLKNTGRFGISTEDNQSFNKEVAKVGKYLQQYRQGKSSLCLGTGEFMYIPFKIASWLGRNVAVQSTTRSPIFELDKPGYAIQHKLSFPSLSDETRNYVYNITPNQYDEVFLFLEREAPDSHLQPLIDELAGVGISRIVIVICSEKRMTEPPVIGSYKKEDVVFLLKDISRSIKETAIEDKEEAIQNGRHYSEMLSAEYEPTKEYMRLFSKTLKETASKVACAVGVVAEQILLKRGHNIVLASLARAGTPVGVLIKRYLKQIHHIDIKHYGISIIRGKGFDENAIRYILQNHPEAFIQFVDGWTGKGAISQVLTAGCADFNARYGTSLSDELAVLADPANCSSLFGTREDFLIPSACLNAPVSGLISRSVHSKELIQGFDYHGAKFYKEWADHDVSNVFVDTISSYFGNVSSESRKQALIYFYEPPVVDWAGLRSIEKIQNEFAISDINLVKPGVGETTRVLLRRVPWLILVDSKQNPNLQHILLLAKDRNVPVYEYKMKYSCCGLIKPLVTENVV